MTARSYLEEDHQEGCDEVVDALDVTRGRVTDGPDVEDPFHHLLDTSLLEQTNQWRHPRDVYCYLSANQENHCFSYTELLDVRPECIFVYVLLFIVEVLVDVARVFLSFPLHHLVRLARWKIAAQDFPHSGPEGGRDS